MSRPIDNRAAGEAGLGELRNRRHADHFRPTRLGSGQKFGAALRWRGAAIATSRRNRRAYRPPVGSGHARRW